MKLALTFDAEHPDRPARPGNTERLLEVLAVEHVQATFFVQGSWASAHPELVRRMAADGHVVGNHSWSHVRMSRLTDRGIDDEITATELLLIALTEDRYSRLFRPPYGDGLRSGGVRRAVEHQGHRMVGWQIDPQDWRPEMTMAELLSSASSWPLDGSIVVFHSWPDCTVAALPAVISMLRCLGAEFEAAAA